MSTSTTKKNVINKSVRSTRTSITKNEDKEKDETKRKIKVSGTNGVVKATTSSSNTVTKKRVPNSPTSTRVSKQQYFPDKNLYSKTLQTATATTGSGTPKIKPSVTKNVIKSKTSTTTPKISKDINNPVKNASKSKEKEIKTKISPNGVLKSQSKPKPTIAQVKQDMRNKLKKSTIVAVTKSKTSSPESTDNSDRPRTATLKRPSIVSTNIAGPEAIKFPQFSNMETESIPESIQSESLNSEFQNGNAGTSNSKTIKSTEDLTYDYEDDFDSYASEEFEEYHSSASNQSPSLNSSSEPLDVDTDGEETSSSSSNSESLSKQEKEAINKSKGKLPINTSERRINSAEEERKLDSGNFDMPNEDFKKVQVLDKIKEHEAVPLSSLSDEGFEEAKTSLQFVNFSEAKKKRQLAKQKVKVNQRGQELMSMIRLDQQNFTLFDLPAKTYDEFIKSFGNRGSTQVASQTGDDRVNEEIQTDEIKVCNKWTQFPIDKITKSKNPLQFKEELLGVGSDTLEVNLLKDQHILEYNEFNLERFLLKQERLIGELLKEGQYGTNVEMTTGRFPFTQGYLLLNTEKHPPTKLVAFSNSNKNPKVITLHEIKDNLKSEGLVWSLLKPTIPEDYFTAYGEVTDITFGLDNDKLIFAGFKDGSLAIWDLLEDLGNDQVRPPSFLTEVDLSLTDAIIKVLCFRTLKSNDFQIVTLNELGTIIIWGLIIKPTESLGLNRVSLVKNNTIQLRDDFHDQNLVCTDLCLNQIDPHHLYVSTNYGVILHTLISGTRTNPKKYYTGISSGVNVLETCPHNPDYFLAGCQSGEIVLLTRQFEKALMTISNQMSEASVQMVQWSRNRPCVFYTVDAGNNINIWDLNQSDLMPSVTIALKEKIKTFKVSPLESETSHMAVVTGDGKTHLHLFNQEHGMQEVEVYASDLKKLNNYIRRL